MTVALGGTLGKWVVGSNKRIGLNSMLVGVCVPASVYIHGTLYDNTDLAAMVTSDDVYF